MVGCRTVHRRAGDAEGDDGCTAAFKGTQASGGFRLRCIFGFGAGSFAFGIFTVAVAALDRFLRGNQHKQNLLGLHFSKRKPVSLGSANLEKVTQSTILNFHPSKFKFVMFINGLKNFVITESQSQTYVFH